MFRSMMLRGASAGALAIALVAPMGALAQESLPTIDIGGESRGTAGTADSGKLTPQNSYVVPRASTGTKTDTPVMDTPVNIQAVTEKALQDQQAITVVDALRNVSGLTAPSGVATSTFTRGGSIFLRGFATQDIYRDGFRISPTGQLNEDAITSRQIANVQSVEVLKGPAAILYGRSEPGGIVNLVTKDPLDTPHYGITQQVGSLALYRTTVNATGPLTGDKSVVYRIDASYENNGAPFGSQIDGTHSENAFVAPAVKWNIDDSTWVKAEFEYNNDKSSLYAPIALRYSGIFVPLPRNFNYATSDVAEHQPSVFASVTVGHNFNEDWSIKQRVAFNHIDVSQSGGSYIPQTLQGGTTQPTVVTNSNLAWGKESTLSLNLDLVGHFDTFGAKHTLLFGGDYYRTSSSSNVQINLPWSWARWNLAAPFAIPIAPLSAVTTAQAFVSRQDTGGLYIQDQLELPYHIFILAGARYQAIHQESSTATTARSFLAWPLRPDALPLEASRVTPRFGLLWRPQPWVSLYGNYTEGFSPNKGAVFGPPVTLAQPSTAMSWEAGAKFEFFDGRLRANADYYYLEKTNIGIGDPDPTHICGASTCSLIVGKARSTGPEVDIQGTLLPGWDVILNYTNQDVRIVEGKSNGSGQAGVLPGQRFPNVPRNLASLWSTYEFQNASLKGLKVGAGYTYHGSQPYFDRTNGIPGAVPLNPAYGTVDLMAAYSFNMSGYKTTAQLNVSNLFDRTYYTSGSVLTAAAPGFQIFAYRSYGAPFSVAGQLRVEY